MHIHLFTALIKLDKSGPVISLIDIMQSCTLIAGLDQAEAFMSEH